MMNEPTQRRRHFYSFRNLFAPFFHINIVHDAIVLRAKKTISVMLWSKSLASVTWDLVSVSLLLKRDTIHIHLNDGLSVRRVCSACFRYHMLTSSRIYLIQVTWWTWASETTLNYDLFIQYDLSTHIMSAYYFTTGSIYKHIGTYVSASCRTQGESQK